MTPEELHKIMKSRVAGVMGDDLRDEIQYVFRERTGLIPKPERKAIEELATQYPDVMATIVDIAAIAAQCRLRRAHGLPEPLR